MNRKKVFLQPVRILAPDHPSTNQMTQRVSQPYLPITSGWPCKSRFKLFGNQPEESVKTPIHPPKLKLQYAMRIKSAEFMLKLGQFDEAILELKRLPDRFAKHPWVIRTHLAAVRAARELTEDIAKH